jgi:hypothetical protein
MIEREYIPNWPRDDERFNDNKSFTAEFGWNLEGRKLAATYWGGPGVGSNAWENAEVVILCDEWHLPRWASVANTQGYREHRAHEGDLGGMSTLRSSAPNVDAIANGHLLRHFKQMALRGNARHYDEHGVCGVQTLVIACDLDRLLANVGMMFPGAKPPRFSAEGSKLADRVLALLNDLPGTVTTIRTAEVEKHIERKWSTVSKRLLTAEFLSALENIGWRYVSKKGRTGSWFARLTDAKRVAVVSTAPPLSAAA